MEIKTKVTWSDGKVTIKIGKHSRPQWIKLHGEDHFLRVVNVQEVSLETPDKEENF